MQVGNSNTTTTPTTPRPKPAVKVAAPKMAPDTGLPGQVWAGASAGRKVSWTLSDIRAAQADGKLYSLKDDLAKQMGVADLGPGATASATARVKSLVGGVLSVQWTHDSYVPGDAHPDSGKAFKAVNLADPSKPIKLTDVFPEADVYKALMGDPIVKKALGTAQPKDLAALQKALEYKQVKANGHEYIFDPELLGRFAIHHVQGGDAYVRLGLEAANGADRDAFTQLGLKLPIPADLRAEYQAAEAAGTLAKALDKVPAAKDMKAKLR
ncbi:MAG: secreted protein [Cyanobacteria bacterium RYN_339]|nr:secreted protein [Cyanobacteria bacterium RYN_339]